MHVSDMCLLALVNVIENNKQNISPTNVTQATCLYPFAMSDYRRLLLLNAPKHRGATSFYIKIVTLAVDILISLLSR